jgi:hypothetical protein
MSFTPNSIVSIPVRLQAPAQQSREKEFVPIYWLDFSVDIQCRDNDFEWGACKQQRDPSGKAKATDSAHQI